MVAPVIQNCHLKNMNKAIYILYTRLKEGFINSIKGAFVFVEIKPSQSI